MRIVTTDETQTEASGAALAHSLPSALPSRALRIYLSGDLGAGKTTFVRGFLRGLGVEGHIKSPTYSLLEFYGAPPWQLLHLDFYRLAEPDDVLALGLADHDVAQSLWLIEWPERAQGVLPIPDLVLRLSGRREHHELEFKARSEVGSEWLRKALLTPEFSAAEH